MKPNGIVLNDIGNVFLTRTVHTSLVWLGPSLSMRMHVNGNYNGNFHVRTHAIQRVEREWSSHTILLTHMSVHCGYRDMMLVCTCGGIGLKFHTT